jgi:hypothetical protein
MYCGWLRCWWVRKYAVWLSLKWICVVNVLKRRSVEIYEEFFMQGPDCLFVIEFISYAENWTWTIVVMEGWQISANIDRIDTSFRSIDRQTKLDSMIRVWTNRYTLCNLRIFHWILCHYKVRGCQLLKPPRFPGLRPWKTIVEKEQE